MRNIYYSLEEIKKFFKETYNAEIIVEEKINEDLVFFIIHREPENSKPNWIWYALKFDVKKDFNRNFYWRLLSPKDTHINGLRKSYDLYFKYYDEDNKNKRLVPRYDDDQNVIKTNQNKE